MNVQDNSGWTPLHCAANLCHLKTCHLLLQQKLIDVSLLTAVRTLDSKISYEGPFLPSLCFSPSLSRYGVLCDDVGHAPDHARGRVGWNELVCVSSAPRLQQDSTRVSLVSGSSLANGRKGRRWYDGLLRQMASERVNERARIVWWPLLTGRRLLIVNATNNRGDSPVHMACLGSNVESVRFLLSNDANVNYENAYVRSSDICK